MYFGSVKFFKRVVTAAVLFVVAGLIASTVTFALLLGKNVEENKALSAAVNAFRQADKLNVLKDGKFTAEQLAELLKSANVEDKDIIKAVYEKDPDGFSKILSEIGYNETGANSSEKNPAATESYAPESEETPPNYEKLYPELYSSYKPPAEYDKDENRVYLTFDDGPSENTDGVLEYLKQNNVKATFFVIPTNTEACAKRLNRILKEGHTLGIHTFSHDYNKIYKSTEAFLNDFNSAFELVYKQTGFKPFLYRFPGGSINDYNKETRDGIIAEMNRRGFVYYDWNVDSQDSLGANWTKMMKNVESEVKNVPRAIILFHDGAGRKNTVLVIDDVIKKLKSNPKGYSFGAITEKTRPMQF